MALKKHQKSFVLIFGFEKKSSKILRFNFYNLRPGLVQNNIIKTNVLCNRRKHLPFVWFSWKVSVEVVSLVSLLAHTVWMRYACGFTCGAVYPLCPNSWTIILSKWLLVRVLSSSVLTSVINYMIKDAVLAIPLPLNGQRQHFRFFTFWPFY